MKVYVLNKRIILKLSLYLVAIMLITAAAWSFNAKTGTVFNGKREIPIYSVDCAQKNISITFDCAWGADDIPKILEVLREQHVKATFFFVGLWAEKNPDVVRQIALDGHDIANHSYSHLRMGAIDNAKIKSEISQCNKILEDLSGRKVELFRAPYGDYNDKVVLIAKEMGCFTIQWDVDSLDWKPGITKDEIMRRISQKVKTGSILLFHNDTAHTAEMLADIITMLKQKGYNFLPVSELIYKDNYTIDHEGKQSKTISAQPSPQCYLK